MRLQTPQPCASWFLLTFALSGALFPCPGQACLGQGGMIVASSEPPAPHQAETGSLVNPALQRASDCFVIAYVSLNHCTE